MRSRRAGASDPAARDGTPWGSTVWPTAARGWVALGAAAVGLGSWVVLPVITSLFADAYPVTDTYVMPVIGLVLTVLAAVVNVLAVGPGRQRSAVGIVAAGLTVGAALFFGFFVIGEGLGGA